ncbi:MAG: D-isomer specific 2-hydroxyacid dehydrogenase family protein [Fervidobacterium sp.]|uniref:D-isomer specific 2-hydroxyacid dehydrogenase family protein n=1 Tax=Fervidobacterium sp. TaxID=1871331 RepID=UPI004049FC21
MRDKLAIVNSSSFGKYFPEHLQKLREYLDVESFTFPSKLHGKELADALAGYKYIIASTSPFFDSEFFEYKDETVIISRHGLGYDNIDVVKATEKGVIVTKVGGGTEREAVAEHAVALCMSIIRKVPQAYIAVKNSEWSKRQSFFGIELKDKVVGIIGYGNIGSRVGEIVHFGFGASVLFYDPYAKEDAGKNIQAKRVELDELLKNSDIIFICSSLTKENYHILSVREFEMMKKGVYIINTSRGELIDQDTLINALDSGKIGGIGFDVVEGEPITGDHPLLRYDNVIITPHIAAYTFESMKGMGDKVVSDILRAVQKIIPDEVVNKDVISKLEAQGWRRI